MQKSEPATENWNKVSYRYVGHKSWPNEEWCWRL